MTHRLCVCSASANGEYYMSTFDKHLSQLTKSITLGSAPRDFQEVKKSGDPIIVFVEGAVGHEVLKDLCDDYNLPKEQRRVRWVHSQTAGVDVFRLGELTKELKDIPFTNARGCYASILAEHVIYSMLYFNRQTWRLQASRAEHKWDVFNMIELRGQSLGIIGYGDIGHATAKLATNMGMEVTGVKRSAPAAEVDEYGVQVVHGEAECNRVLRESDFVVSILPGTEETKEFFNKDRFAMMKPSAIFMNVGRGITQSEDDLAWALRDGVIAGASVDVFAQEPLPADSPLWNIGDDKLLLSPHSADRTAHFIPSSVRRFIGLAEKYVKTGKLDAYLVDLSRGY